MINVCNSMRLLSKGFICDEIVKDCYTFMDNTLHNFMIYISIHVHVRVHVTSYIM